MLIGEIGDQTQPKEKPDNIDTTSKSTEVIMRRSITGIIEYVSTSSKEVNGYVPDELVGRSCYDFIHPDDISDYSGPLARGEIDIATYTFRTKHRAGHYIWTETTITAIKDSSSIVPKQLLSISRDITVRQKAYNHLMESRNLSVIGQLAAGIAHEIRNPLTTIQGFLQLMLSEEEIKREYLELMQGEVGRIDQISRELMLLGKPVEDHVKKTDMCVLLRTVIMLMEPESNLHNVQFKVEVGSEPIHVFCNEVKIKQVFINVIKNGIDAMPGGGILKISLSIDRDDSQLVVLISDNGCGIQEEDMGKLAEPFFTTKEKGNGLG